MSQVNEAIIDSKIHVAPIYKAQTDAFGIFDYPFLMDLIRNNGVKKFLDVGTGEGSFLSGLAEKTDNVLFDAIDINEHLIKVAKSNNMHLRLNINFQEGNFGSDYVESNYDLIMARFAIEHIKELDDIYSFLKTGYEKLRTKGWIAIIEYYVHELDIGDPIWAKFRKGEIATYNSVNAHTRIALKLPNLLMKVGFKNIRSTINHISPSVIGNSKFFNLVQEYTKLYSQIAPEYWPNEITYEILSWCDKKQLIGEPTIFTSHTIGQKAL